LLSGFGVALMVTRYHIPADHPHHCAVTPMYQEHILLQCSPLHPMSTLPCRPISQSQSCTLYLFRVHKCPLIYAMRWRLHQPPKAAGEE
jgi:hypothetical protein